MEIQEERASRRSTSSSKGLKNYDTTRAFAYISKFMWTRTPMEMFVYLGILIEGFQILGLIVNPFFAYVGVLSTPISYTAWSMHMPIWDTRYMTNVDFTVYTIVVLSILGLASVFTTIVFVLYCADTLEQKDNRLNDFLKLVIHAFGGFFFFPAAHSFGVLLFCNEGSLWTFQDVTCWEFPMVLPFVVAILMFLLLFGIAFIGATCLYDDVPTSTHPKRRAHSFVDFYQLLFKTLSVLAFHVLIGTGHETAFCILYGIANLIMVVAYVCINPYYNQNTNSMYTTFHVVAGFCCCLSLAEIESPHDFRKSDMKQQLFLSLTVAVASIGWSLGSARVYGRCRRSLQLLRYFGYTLEHTASYPHGLPVHEIVTQRYKALEDDVINEGLQEGAPRGAEQLCLPYVSSIVLETDIELSTRILMLHRQVTGKPLSGYMLGYSCRIFLKGLHRFKDSGVVLNHFAQYLFHHANKVHAAVDAANDCLGRKPVLFVQFAAYRLIMTIQGILGLRDQTHMQSFIRARHLHHTALKDMTTFWGRLLDAKKDVIQLATLANSISTKRLEGMKEYCRALENNGASDRDMLTQFALFLETVAHNTQAAILCRQRADQIAEERKSRVMAGSKTQQAQAQSQPFDIEDILETMENDSTVNLGKGGSDSVFWRYILLISAFVVVTLLCMFVVTMTHFTYQQTALKRAHATSIVRTQTQQALARVDMYRHHNVFQQFPESIIRQWLGDTYVDIRQQINSLVWGDLKTADSETLELTNQHLVTMEYGSQMMPQNVWGAGNAMASVAYSVANALFESPESITTAYNIVEDNAPTNFLFIQNETIVANENDIGLHVQRTIMFLAILFVVSVMGVYSMALLINISFRRMGVTKVVTLRLFDLIPYATTSGLHTKHKQMVEAFMSQNQEEEEAPNAGAAQMQQIDTELMEGVVAKRRASTPGGITSILKDRTKKSVGKKKGVRFNLQSDAKEDTDGVPSDHALLWEKLRPAIDRITSSHTRTELGFMKTVKNGKLHYQQKARDEVAQQYNTAVKALQETKDSLGETTLTMWIQLFIDKEREKSMAKVRMHERLMGHFLAHPVGRHSPGCIANNFEISSELKQEVHLDNQVMDPGCQKVTQAHEVDDKLFKQLDEMSSESVNTLRVYTQGLRRVKEPPPPPGVMRNGKFVATRDIEEASDIRPGEGQVSSGGPSTANSTSSQNSRTSTVINWQMYLFYALLLLAACGHTITSGISASRTGTLNQLYQNRSDALMNIQRVRATRALQSFYARSFASVGNSKHLALYWTTRNGDPFVTRAPTIMKYLTQANQTDALVAWGHQWANMDSLEATALLAALQDYDVDSNIRLQAIGIKEQVETSRQFWESIGRRPDIRASSCTKLRGKAKARCILSSDEYQLSWKLFLAGSTNLATLCEIDHDERINIQGQIDSAIVGVYFGSASIAVLAIIYFLTRGLKKNMLILSVTLLSLVLALTSLGLMAYASQQVLTVKENWKDTDDVFSIARKTEVQFLEEYFYAGAVAMVGDPVALFKFDDIVPTRTVYLDQLGYYTDYSIFNQLQATMKNLQSWLSVSVGLAFWGYNLPPEYETSNMRKMYWDSRQEDRSLGTSPYTSKDQDKVASTDTQITAGLNAAFGDRSANAFQSCMTLLQNIRLASFHESDDNGETKSRNHFQSSIGAFSLSVSSLILITMVVLARVLTLGTEARTEQQSVIAVSNVLFQTEIRRTKVAFVAAMLVISGVFVHGVVSSSLSLPYAQTTKDAHTRDLYVAMSLFQVQELWVNINSNQAYFTSQNKIRSYISLLENARSTLYFGSQRGSYRGVTISDAQNSFTFKQGTNGTADAPVDNLYIQWIDLLSQVVSLTDTTSPKMDLLGNVVSSIETLAPTLLSRLRQSANIYCQSGLDVLTSEITIQIILIIVGILVLIGVYGWCLRPTLARMEEEEAGNRILVQMIPQDVRQHVPKIRLYLATGKLTSTEDDSAANPEAPEFSQFIQSMERGEPIKECMAILDRSEVGFIVIDSHGIIQGINFIAGALGFTPSEAIGAPVTAIMGEPDRTLHDAYLHRYMNTGVSRIMNTARDIYAQHKNGTQVHIYVRLGEMVRPDTHSKYFMAQVRPYPDT
eukprot:PhF_6_TR1936/c0_g1_i1/m.3032